MTAPTRELERTRNGAKVMERTLEAAAARIKDLEDALRPIVADAQRPFHFSTDGVVPVLYKHIHRAAALLEKK